ncbi:MAG: hypothetical protein LBJ46_08380 [Planctomycetota bacterium]|jgi:hypothetical protein|nr:hypothetical protein [Planctomycetota bacterium]
MAMIGGERLAILAAPLFLLVAGCYDNVWWDYRDDPYLAEMAPGGTAEALRNVNSVYLDTRQVALRTLAEAAGRARAKGNAAEADRLTDAVIRRYRQEKDASVRMCIVLVCAPAVGGGSTPMASFLRERIAAGEFPGYAALSLAHLSPGGAYEDIVPLTRHPSPEVRLQSAVALTILADPRGRDAVARVLWSMRSPEWPDEIAGRALEEAGTSLRQRAERTYGPLFN